MIFNSNQKPSCSSSSIFQTQPCVSCPRLHMGYMTDQGIQLSLCSVPLMQRLRSAPKSVCASCSPADCKAGQGCLMPQRATPAAGRELGRDSERLVFIFWSAWPAKNLSVRLPHHIYNYIGMSWQKQTCPEEKSHILSWRQLSRSHTHGCCVPQRHKKHQRLPQIPLLLTMLPKPTSALY